MNTIKAILTWLLWLVVASIVTFLALWFGTGEETWFAGEVRGHQVENYFKDVQP